ncbi:MAG: hypothetical protein J4F97_04625, partial [Pseudomonadales bacterium]|nr:hypothetical protein [Pseudomonadales bacterium]
MSPPPPLPPPYRRALSPDDPAPVAPKHRVFDFHPVTLHPMARDPLELGVPGLAEARTILAVVAPLFGDDPAGARRHFEKPSNPAFQALEYQSVNCCFGCPTCFEECVTSSDDAGEDGEIDLLPPAVSFCYCVAEITDPDKIIGVGSDDGPECEDGEECEPQVCPEGEECNYCPDADGDGDCDGGCPDSDDNGVCDCLDEDRNGVCDCPYGSDEGRCQCRDEDENEGKGNGVCDDCVD